MCCFKYFKLYKSKINLTITKNYNIVNYQFFLLFFSIQLYNSKSKNKSDILKYKLFIQY